MTYLVVQESNNIDKIKDNIYEWKLMNISTYIINIIYNNSYITFDFSYNSIYIYHFNIKYNGIKWQLELDIILNEGVDITNNVYIVLIDIIKKINVEIEENEYPNKILTLIEKYIEDTDFEEDIEEIDEEDVENVEEIDKEDVKEIDEEDVKNIEDLYEEDEDYCIEDNENCDD